MTLIPGADRKSSSPSRSSTSRTAQNHQPEPTQHRQFPDDLARPDSDQPDDYDRASGVEGLAEVIGPRGRGDVSALVLGDEPATTRYLPEQRAFMRWLAADSAAELLAAAETALNDPATPREECGLWETDGPAVLMDSAEAGTNLGMPYPDGRGEPDPSPRPPTRRTPASPRVPEDRQLPLDQRASAPSAGRQPVDNDSLTRTPSSHPQPRRDGQGR
ncbi:Imm21 family immunity protein [Kitasatospora sp. NPDC058063]|uniref:Imm21 family immunity protein n=1 Tax=unclassified Kitasatospora TaxID=2633591 RepID=UPI0036DD183B